MKTKQVMHKKLKLVATFVEKYELNGGKYVEIIVNKKRESWRECDCLFI